MTDYAHRETMVQRIADAHERGDKVQIITGRRSGRTALWNDVMAELERRRATTHDAPATEDRSAEVLGD